MVILSPRASGFAELGLEGCDPRDRAAELGREGRDGLSNQPFWGYENLGKPDQKWEKWWFSVVKRFNHETPGNFEGLMMSNWERFGRNSGNKNEMEI